MKMQYLSIYYFNNIKHCQIEVFNVIELSI